jgi:hypothetical protein
MMTMDKKPSFLWALGIGAVFPLVQVLIYLLRFGRFNPYAQPIEYVYFFAAGALAGVSLIYFLRRSDSTALSRAVIIAFVLGIPFGLFGMIMGGLLGPLGMLLFGVSPIVFVTAVGYFIGRMLSRRGKQIA